MEIRALRARISIHISSYFCWPRMTKCRRAQIADLKGANSGRPKKVGAKKDFIKSERAQFGEAQKTRAQKGMAQKGWAQMVVCGCDVCCDYP